MSATPRYAPVQRGLHWLIALLVVGVFAGGQIIDNYGFEGMKAAFGLDMTNRIYMLHKTFGIVILALMAARIAARLTFGKPEYRPPLSPIEAKASAAVHGLFYVLLILMPVLGWAATATGGFPVQFFGWNLPPLFGKDEALSETLFGLHGAVGSVIALLVVVHVAAAIRHAAVNRDGVMRRMI